MPRTERAEQEALRPAFQESVVSKDKPFLRKTQQLNWNRRKKRSVVTAK